MPETTTCAVKTNRWIVLHFAVNFVIAEEYRTTGTVMQHVIVKHVIMTGEIVTIDDLVQFLWIVEFIKKIMISKFVFLVTLHDLIVQNMSGFLRLLAINEYTRQY